MANLLVDSDVLIDHLRGTQVLHKAGDRLSYSVVSRAELFAGGHERQVRELLDPLREIPVDREIAERAGRVRRETSLRLPDALIAATALEHRLTVLTRNVSHFRRVRGLRVRAPK